MPNERFSQETDSAKLWKLQADYDSLLDFATYWHQEALKRGCVAGTTTITPKLSPDLIDRLIRFCHPDKHDNSTIANELTAELLKLRNTQS